MGVVYTLTGPSGSGKSSIAAKLTEMFGVPELTSHTTREARPGEKHGVHYYFVSREEFDDIPMVERVEYSGNLYGLSVKEVEQKLKQYPQSVVVVDINGVQQVKDMFPEETVSIFIDVTREEIADRMRVRGDSEEEISKRLKYAEANDEFDNWFYTDYSVRNFDLNKAVESVALIMRLRSPELKRAS